MVTSACLPVAASAPRAICARPRSSTDSAAGSFVSSFTNTPTDVPHSLHSVRAGSSLRATSCQSSWTACQTAVSSSSRRSQHTASSSQAASSVQAPQRTTGFDPSPSMTSLTQADAQHDEQGDSAMGLLRRQLSVPSHLLADPVSRLKARLESDLSNEHVSAERGSPAWLAARNRCPALQDPHVQRAYVIAAAAHDGQTRRDGSPVVEHCEQTAIALADLGLNAATVSAALLHDVLDDSAMTGELLRGFVTGEVADLVTQVSKVSAISQLYRSDASMRTPASLDALASMLTAMGDPRVVLIKLADRLHNMRTLSALSLEARKRVAQETSAVFVPLANRLGVWSFKAELEDLCLQHTEPEKFAALQGRVAQLVADHKGALGGFLADTAALMRTKKVPVLELNGRTKSLSAIYQKLDTPSSATGNSRSLPAIYQKLDTPSSGNLRGLGDVHDVLAIRVIVPTKSDCYLALRNITGRFHAQEGRLKDFIRTPKANGYQSLHTVVYTDEGTPIEVQIRTDKMHFIAEYGVASHWRYKERRGKGGKRGSGDSSDEDDERRGKGGKRGSGDSSAEDDEDAGVAMKDRVVTWQRMFLAFSLRLRDNKVRPAGSNPHHEACLQAVGSSILDAVAPAFTSSPGFTSPAAARRSNSGGTVMEPVRSSGHGSAGLEPVRSSGSGCAGLDSVRNSRDGSAAIEPVRSSGHGSTSGHSSAAIGSARSSANGSASGHGSAAIGSARRSGSSSGVGSSSVLGSAVIGGMRVRRNSSSGGINSSAAALGASTLGASTLGAAACGASALGASTLGVRRSSSSTCIRSSTSSVGIDSSTASLHASTLDASALSGAAARSGAAALSGAAARSGAAALGGTAALIGAAARSDAAAISASSGVVIVDALSGASLPRDTFTAYISGGLAHPRSEAAAQTVWIVTQNCSGVAQTGSAQNGGAQSAAGQAAGQNGVGQSISGVAHSGVAHSGGVGQSTGAIAQSGVDQAGGVGGSGEEGSSVQRGERSSVQALRAGEGATLCGVAASGSFPAGTRAADLLLNGAPAPANHALRNGDIVSLSAAAAAASAAVHSAACMMTQQADMTQQPTMMQQRAVAQQMSQQPAMARQQLAITQQQPVMTQQQLAAAKQQSAGVGAAAFKHSALVKPTTRKASSNTNSNGSSVQASPRRHSSTGVPLPPGSDMRTQLSHLFSGMLAPDASPVPWRHAIH